MFNQIIGGIIRHVLSAYGGTLVAKGLITASQLDQGIGATIVIITIVLSMLQKYRATKKFDPKTLVKPAIPIEKA